MTISQYYFEFPNRRDDFFYDVEEEMFEIKDSPERPASLPAWTRLDFHRCSHCTLSDPDVHYCPAALNMVELVERFSECVSFETVTLHVTTTTQKHSTTTDLQTALAYLYPVILLKSTCPYASLLRPVEKFIKPFFDLDDALFYVLSFHLIKKHLFAGGPDSSSAMDDYKDPSDIAMAFHGLLDRVREASHNDANINAIFKDIQWAYSILHSREHILDRMRPYFTK